MCEKGGDVVNGYAFCHNCLPTRVSLPPSCDSLDLSLFNATSAVVGCKIAISLSSSVHVGDDDITARNRPRTQAERALAFVVL